MTTSPVGMRPGLPAGNYVNSRIEVVYEVQAGADEVATIAEAIAYEQTVELPPALIADPLVRERVVGRVEDIVPARPTHPNHPTHDDADAVAAVRISYSAALANDQILSLLNLVYGNASIYPGVRLRDLVLPTEFLQHFRGPQFGVDGVRKLVDVKHRPLLATAIKPRGAMGDYMSSIVYQFAVGGGDLVKDDQNLVDDFDTFRWRVTGCVNAVRRANEETGRNCLYLPHLSAPFEQLERYLEFAYQVGVKGVLVCPLLLGLDTTRGLLANYPLVVMAHPALSGSYLVNEHHGIEHGVLLGTLFRLAGADISIFPNAGGRFSFSQAACDSIAAHLRHPLGLLRPALPCPAGGMGYADLQSMAKHYGRDAVLLVGGALLGFGDHLVDSTRAFVERLEAVAQDDYPAADGAYLGGSIDEIVPVASDVLRRISFQEGFTWQDRESTRYKDGVYDQSDSLAFKGVRRVELVGKFGERTRCDLRYFEVAPGGFTSHEQHVHTHIIIGARGSGVLRLDDEERPFNAHDVAYIAPLQGHQLRNETSAPFGFYCIVDHERDRPVNIQ